MRKRYTQSSNIDQFDVIDTRLSVGIVDSSCERFGLVGRVESGSDLVLGRVSLQDTLARHFGSDISEGTECQLGTGSTMASLRGSSSRSRSETLESFSDSDLGQLGPPGLGRSRVDKSIASTGNIVGIDVQRNESFQVEFLFLQSILIRVLVELERDKLNDQFLRCENDSTNEQREQDIGDSRQVVSADVGCSFVSTNDQWLESDPGRKHPYD